MGPQGTAPAPRGLAVGPTVGPAVGPTTVGPTVGPTAVGPTIGATVGPGDRTTPFYPTQRGREEPWPSTTPVPIAAHVPGTAVLPPRGPGERDRPEDHTAPLPRTGDEPLTSPAPLPDPSEERGPTPTASGHPGGPTPTPEDDPGSVANWELVRAAQEGDAEAFGELFDHYHDIVFRFVLYRLGDRPLAEDLTQETFVRAYRRLSSVSYQGRDIGAWFVTIARNLVLDHVKSSRYRLESTIGEVSEIVDVRAGPGPESEVVAGLVHAELLRCVDRLRPDQRECIDLRFLQGLSVSETAAAMDRNEGAVKALQHRAVKRLHQLLPEGLR